MPSTYMKKAYAYKLADTLRIQRTIARNLLVLKSILEIEDFFGCPTLSYAINHMGLEDWDRNCVRVLLRNSMDTYSSFSKAFFYTS